MDRAMRKKRSTRPRRQERGNATRELGAGGMGAGAGSGRHGKGDGN